MRPPYIIIGGGIGGLCTAIALQRKGFEAHIYERVPRIEGVGAGLVLGSNAMQALHQIGIAEAILPETKAIAYMGIRSRKGKWLSRNDMRGFADTYGMGNHTIHRADLHRILVSLLAPGTLHQGKACTSVLPQADGVVLGFEDGSERTADYVIGADGIHSLVRKAVAPLSKIRYSGYTCWRGVIAADPERFDLEQFSETWGINGRFGIVPLARERIYFFATKNAPANDSRMANWAVADLRANFAGYHDPIDKVLAAAEGSPLLWNDIIDFPPLAHYAYDRILLCGDAAHATTPNLGQGAGMAIEDAACLANCLEKEKDPVAAFRRFEKLRLNRTHRIVNTSWQFGRLTQTESPLLSGLRNLAISLTPNKVNERQFEWLYRVDLGAH